VAVFMLFDPVMTITVSDGSQALFEVNEQK
jgi:hypothetical protein